MVDPTEYQIGLMRHALGISDENRDSYRNYFAASPKSGDCNAWFALVKAGYAAHHGKKGHYGDLIFFSVADKGEVLARRFPPRPKLTRPKARYKQFIDGDFGCSFFEFLKCYHNGKTTP